MDLKELDSTKLTYNDIIEGLPIKAPKWAREVYQQGGEPVCAIDFYQDIFKDGYLEPHREREDYQTGEYGGIVVKARKTTAEERAKTGRTSIAERYTFTDGCDELTDVIKNAGTDFVFLSAASYAGKQRTNANARYLYAIVYEIDNIKEATKRKADGIEQLFFSFGRLDRVVPKPTYIVCSGTGLHLYYVLEKPIPAFKNVLESVNKWRREIIAKAWDGVSTDAKKDIQYEHALQGFRAVGARTKGQTFAMAFKTGTEWSIEDLNEYVKPQNQISLIYQSKVRLAQAKELYPEWYERRIVKGQKEGNYKRSEGIYQNWISKIYEQSSVGHRYYCLLELVALATQCDIPFDQLEDDAYHLTQYMDTLTTDAEKNPFTAYDMECALNMYGSEDAFNRKVEYVEQATGIQCPRAKRNGRNRQQHLKLMNLARELDCGDEWREGNGAKPKWAQVQEWRKANPNGSKAQCIRDTGLSKPTVLKWWDESQNPDATGIDYEAKIKEWQRHNPSGSKQACHKATGASMYYINKVWKTGTDLHKRKYIESLTMRERAFYVMEHGKQIPIKKLQPNHRTSLERLLDDNELLK